MEVLSMAVRVGLRTGQYRKFCRMRGWVNENQQAHGLGVSPSTVNRILKGAQRPSGEFIGAVLTAFPELEFSDLFEVVDDTTPQQMAEAGSAALGSLLIVLLLALFLLAGVTGFGAA